MRRRNFRLDGEEAWGRLSGNLVVVQSAKKTFAGQLDPEKFDDLPDDLTSEELEKLGFVRA